MRLVLADPTYLKDSITIISELVTEGRFKIKKNEIELIAMDPANVAMIIFRLLSSCFATYDVPEEKEINLNLTNLKQVLKRASAKDIVSLSVTNDNKLEVQLKSNTIRTFSIPLLELDEREQKVPTLTFPVNITLPSTTLNNAIEDVDIVAESVSFIAEPNKFSITATGDLSKANIEMNKGDDIKIDMENDKTIRAKYSIEYLKKIIQGSKISNEAALHFNDNYPLKVDYRVIDKVLISFILAPRVDND